MRVGLVVAPLWGGGRGWANHEVVIVVEKSLVPRQKKHILLILTLSLSVFAADRGGKSNTDRTDITAPNRHSFTAAAAT
jgi:hypothetical protein